MKKGSEIWYKKGRVCENCGKPLPKGSKYKLCSDKCRLEFWAKKIDFLQTHKYLKISKE